MESNETTYNALHLMQDSINHNVYSKNDQNVLLIQFTMYKLNFSFNLFGDLQNYIFLESLEHTEPEK